MLNFLSESITEKQHTKHHSIAFHQNRLPHDKSLYFEALGLHDDNELEKEHLEHVKSEVSCSQLLIFAWKRRSNTVLWLFKYK
jgi:hypothetical protein